MKTPTYDELIKSGQSPSIALILSSRQAPGVHGTDTTAFAGFGSLKKQLGRDFDRVTESAKKHGYTPGSHDVYNPTFARFEGDPRAFSSQAQGVAHYRKLAEIEGTGATGDISVAPRLKEPKKLTKKLAPDILNAKLKQEAKRNPDILRKDRREVISQIVDKYAI